MQKTLDTKIRKLPLPLEIKIGSDGSVSDGLFTLTSKEANRIRIISIDEDGYVSCEISPPTPWEMVSIPVPDLHAFLGAELSKTRGRGKDFGKYEYYKKSNGNLYVVISGTRPHTLQLGSLSNRNSPISTIARSIKQTFGVNEFSKSDLTKILPKRISYGQMLKSILDVMRIEGYLERKEVRPKGRLHELFKATEKLDSVIVATASPEQSQKA